MTHFHVAKRPIISNGIGVLGVGCSLLFWSLISFRVDISRYALFSRLPFYFWFEIWAISAFLLVIAGVLGSKRWLAAIALPVVSCAVALFLSGF
jgi:hypothetical protein